MQKLITLLQSAKVVSIENIFLKRPCIQEAIDLLKDIDTSTDVKTQLYVNLETCLRNLDGIEIYHMGNQEVMVEVCLVTYNRLLDECIEFVNPQIPSDLMFELVKESVNHINRLEVGYAGFDRAKLNEMFVESVQKIIEEMTQKSKIMAQFVANDYIANQKAEKWGRD